MANPSNSLRTIAWAVVMAVAIVAGAGTARAQCTGNIYVSGFPVSGPCAGVSFVPVFDCGDCPEQFFFGNGTYIRALCCCLNPGPYLSVRFAGKLVEPGETKKITTPCGCIEVIVGLPDINGAVNVSLTYLGSGPCP